MRTHFSWYCTMGIGTYTKRPFMDLYILRISASVIGRPLTTTTTQFSGNIKGLCNGIHMVSRTLIDIENDLEESRLEE